MKLTLDASVHLSALDPSSPSSSDCQALLRRLHSGEHGSEPSGEPSGEQSRPAEVISPTLLIVEVASAVARVLGEPDLAAELNQKLRYLPHQAMIPLSQLLAEETSRLAARYELRSADAVYGAVAQLYGSTLVTLDPVQLENLSPALTVWRPRQALDQLSAAASS